MLFLSATCAEMMHCPMSKFFEVSGENEPPFSSVPEKVTHYRCQEMKKNPRARDAGRIMIGLYMGVLWPNMQGGFSKC